MEARTAFDRLLTAGDEPGHVPGTVPEPEEARIVAQNREALASWAGAGVPVNQ
jgi:hypothetical protein